MEIYNPLTKEQIDVIARNMIRGFFEYSDLPETEQKKLLSNTDAIKLHRRIKVLAKLTCPANIWTESQSVDNIVKEVRERLP